MVNANKHKKLLNDTETRIKKQKEWREEMRKKMFETQEKIDNCKSHE